MSNVSMSGLAVRRRLTSGSLGDASRGSLFLIQLFSLMASVLLMRDEQSDRAVAVFAAIQRRISGAMYTGVPTRRVIGGSPTCAGGAGTRSLTVALDLLRFRVIAEYSQ